MAEDPTTSAPEPKDGTADALEEQVMARLEEAGQALAGGDWKGAEEAFAQGLSVAPSDSRLHGGLALVAIQEQDWPRAIAHGRQAVSLDGASVEVHYNLGWALEQEDKTDEALDAYKHAFQADPTRPEPILRLLRLGQLPGEASEPESLGTLQRLELYEHLASLLGESGCEHTWAGCCSWAAGRGAPWGAVVAWLAMQGATCDCSVLTTLPVRDEHLAHSVVTGMVLGAREAMVELFSASPEVRVVGEDAPVPNRSQDPDPVAGEPMLTVRLDSAEGRARIPAQRTHAGLLLPLIAEILPYLGPDGACVVTLDPALHLGPRRVWMITGISEAEVVGGWAALDDDGEEVLSELRLSDTPMPLGAIPLRLEGLDRGAIEAAIEAEGLADLVRPSEDGAWVLVDTEQLAEHMDGWRRFLVAVAGLLPRGSTSYATWWGEDGPKLAILAAEQDVRELVLEPRWPSSQGDLGLPIDEKVQLLGRALFQGPLHGRLRG